MRTEPFAEYLAVNYRGERSGTPLSMPPVRDALSRCRRIENVLGIELDFRIDGRIESLEALLNLIEQDNHRFQIDGDLKTGIASIKNAAKRYHDFREWETRGLSCPRGGH